VLFSGARRRSSPSHSSSSTSAHTLDSSGPSPRSTALRDVAEEILWCGSIRRRERDVRCPSPPVSCGRSETLRQCSDRHHRRDVKRLQLPRRRRLHLPPFDGERPGGDSTLARDRLSPAVVDPTHSPGERMRRHGSSPDRSSSSSSLHAWRPHRTMTECFPNRRVPSGRGDGGSPPVRARGRCAGAPPVSGARGVVGRSDDPLRRRGVDLVRSAPGQTVTHRVTVMTPVIPIAMCGTQLYAYVPAGTPANDITIFSPGWMTN
jgi:hypothetical protein